MLRHLKYASIFLISLSTLMSFSSDKCPSVLLRADQISNSKSLNGKSYCEFYNEYQTELEKFKLAYLERNPESQFNSSRIIDLIAPRLIDYEKWEKNKKNQYFYNPIRVYQPAPLTWNNWISAIDKIEEISHSNFTNKNIKPIDLSFVKELHAMTLTGIRKGAGEFRNETEYGYNLVSPLAGKDILTMIHKSTFDGSLHENQSIIGWESTKCLSDLPEETRKRIEAEEKKGQFDYHPGEWKKETQNPITEESKECGVIVYPKHEELDQEMELWAKTLNYSIQLWNSDQALKESPLVTIARTQRWFISLHPFMDGNGRPSRYIMDLMFQSIGLPAPIILDKDRDLYSTDEEWATLLGEGLLKNLEIIKTCNDDIRYPGCKLVPKMEIPK